MTKYLLAAAFLLCAPAVGQGQVVSVQTGAADGLFSQVPLWTGQSFTATRDDVIGGGVRLFASGIPRQQTGTLTFSLYDGRADAGGVLLASALSPYAFTGQTTMWLDAFWSPVTGQLGRSVWLYVQGTFNTPDPVYIMGGLGGYAGGEADVAYYGVDDSHYVDWSAYDIGARLWSSTPVTTPPDDQPPPVDVPEPASLALVLTVASALMARRRRA